MVKKDWLGKKYCGITLDWDYTLCQVNLSMPSYCSEALTRFRQEAGKFVDQPHQHDIPVYGAKIQYVKLADTSPKLGDEDKKFIQ